MPERARFCFIPWQHLLKTDNITGGVCGPRSLGDKTGTTSHPSTSWPAWTLPCWPLAIESLFPSSKGLISAVCPMALSTAGPLWNTMWLQEMRWWTLTAAQHHSKTSCWVGIQTPTQRLVRFHLAHSRKCTHSTKTLVFILPGISSASKFQAGLLVLPLSRTEAQSCKPSPAAPALLLLDGFCNMPQ